MWEVVGASVSRGKVFGRRALRADRGDPLPVTYVAKDEGSGIEAMFAHDPVSLTQRTTGPIVASDRLVPTVRTMTSATFGRIFNAVSSSARQVQLGLKLYW